MIDQMHRLRLLLLTVAAPLLLLQSAYAAPARRALVIGNDAYPGNALQNARNDAKSIANALSDLGYITTLRLDTDKIAMGSAISRFASSITEGDVAVVYYAGHGLQLDGENFLIPTDFKPSRPEQVAASAFSLSDILALIKHHGASTEVVILDACRNNPFLGTRSINGAGWAPTSTSLGTYLAFGTSPGSTASDEAEGEHGLFTDALLHYIRVSDLDLEQLFQKARSEVLERSGGLQMPWIASSLVGTLHIDPRKDADAPALVVRQGARLSETTEEGRSLAPNRGEPIAALPIQLSAAGSAYDSSQEAQEDLNTINMDRAVALTRGGRLQEAVSILERIAAVAPLPAPLRLLGLLLYTLGNHHGAQAAFDRAIALDPLDSSALEYRCLVSLTDPAEVSSEACSAVWRHFPSMASSYMLSGLVQFRDGNLDRADSAVAKALSIDPENRSALALEVAIDSHP